MLTYTQRAQLCTHPLAKKLLLSMERKQTNLSISLDVSDKNKLLYLANLLGPQICVLKTHIDIVEGYDDVFINALTALADKHQFMIFEDRKFADIGNTVKLQYAKGVYHIADWAPITNAHTIMGPGTIAGLKEIGLKKGNGLLLLAELSSKGNLANTAYVQTTIEMANANKDFVIGFVAQQRLTDDPSFITFTPGINLSTTGDSLGQNYQTPQQALAKGSDIIIVGRGIYEAENVALTAEHYRQAGWEAYQALL